MILKTIAGRLGRRKLQAAAVELCEAGLITCTSGEPGDDEATYALAWLPLDHPEHFGADVREQHAENMAKLNQDKAWAP
jgi:hypothetical protein